MSETFPKTPDYPTIKPRSNRRDSSRIKNVWWYVLMIAFFSLGLGTGYIIWGQNSPAETSTVAANQPSENTNESAAAVDPNTPQKVTRYPVTVDDDPSYGPADAPITIIEFSDYECPYCQRWHAEVWPKLQEAFPGQIRLVYRDFPLYNIHPNAGPAAEAANCAGDQQKYWEFHELLFSGENNLGVETYHLYANNLGIDIDQFSDCLESRKYQSEVNADYEFAAQLGIQSTPTFFINGVALIGAQPFEVFQEVINLELAGLLTD